MPNIRHMMADDKKDVQKILNETGMFTREEVDVAMELVDIYLTNGKQKDYLIYVAEADKNQVVGYVCFGPTPATEGAYDVYWIAVLPILQAKGYGTMLLSFAEEHIRNLGGRLILIETSSQRKYGPTQQFYLRNSYTLESRIKDFYRLGDDRLTYVKRLDGLS